MEKGAICWKTAVGVGSIEFGKLVPNHPLERTFMAHSGRYAMRGCDQV